MNPTHPSPTTLSFSPSPPSYTSHPHLHPAFPPPFANHLPVIRCRCELRFAFDLISFYCVVGGSAGIVCPREGPVPWRMEEEAGRSTHVSAGRCCSGDALLMRHHNDVLPVVKQAVISCQLHDAVGSLELLVLFGSLVKEKKNEMAGCDGFLWDVFSLRVCERENFIHMHRFFFRE